MGLLDDAIREHLEFKRRHGADPGEVARQEHEALGPVYRGEGPEPTSEHADIAGSPAPPSEELRSPVASSHSGPVEKLSYGGQETAELDMSTVLKTDPLVQPGFVAEHTRSGLRSGTMPASPSTQSATVEALPREDSAEDSLEWEVPGEASPGGPKRSGGDAHGDAAENVGGPVEDVLEETPDFLRETPDQERLWFEQQPPRDFDFDR